MSPSSPPSLRRTIAAITTACAVLAVIPVVAGPQASVVAAAGSVSGTVFQDFNSNGVMDTTLQLGRAVDVGVAGVSVRLVDSTGVVVGSGTTGASGAFTVTVAAAASLDVRVEFEVDQSVPALAGLVPSFATSTGASNSTYGGVVQFARLGDTGVNLAVNRPGEYCQNDPNLVTCSAEVGVGSANGIGAFTIAGAMNGFTDVTPANSLIASSDDLGAVFGIGADRQRNLYFGTYVKRHIEYGDWGATNTIYRVDLDDPGSVTQFVTLPGTLPAHDPTPPGSGWDRYSGDTAVFEHVGRIGLGDVDVTPDGSTVLAVDMDQSAPKLYFVPILASGTTVTAGQYSHVAIPRPATFAGTQCQGEWHPMGIGVRGSRVLVGGICGAENTVSVSQPRGPHPTEAAAFVLEYFGPLDGGGTFTTIWAQQLDYERGCVYREPGWVECTHSTSSVNTTASADWTAWTEYPRFTNLNGRYFVSGAQPMLANIEILDTGGLVIGLRDRLWDQHISQGAAFSKAYTEPGVTRPGLAYPVEASGMAGGDVLRVCATASGLVTEANGTCPSGDLAGSGYTDLSGVREYFYDSYFSSGAEIHPEIHTGSLATMPGFPGGWVTAYDVTSLGRQGVYAFGRRSTAIGAARGPSSGYGSLVGGADFGNLNGFNKGIGLADIEVLCDGAPVQVGDRVWFDVDGDGVQGAGEGAVVGVRVRLVDAGGVEVASVVTDANGEFRFSSVVAAGSVVASGLGSASGWRLVIDDPLVFGSGGVLAGWGVTEGFVGSGSGVDSDAVVVAGYPSAALPDMVPGVNVLSLDMGFVPLVAVGDRVWFDADSDGVQGSGEVSLAGVRVELLDAAGDPAVDGFGVPVAAQVTGVDGRYLFDGLVPGEYRVRFSAPDGWVPTVTGAGVSGSGSDADRVSGVTPVFTVASGAVGDTVVDTDAGTVAQFVDPTIDAGFVPVVSVGDFVWDDADGDGVFDSGEVPLAGVVLELTGLDGDPVVDVFGVPVGPQVSGVDGSYGFVGLPLGSYRVVASTPDGWVATRPVVDVSAPLLWAGAVDPTLDFGFQRVPEPDPTTTTSTTSTTTSTTTTSTTSTTTSTTTVPVSSGPSMSVPVAADGVSGVVEGVVSVDGGPVSGAVVVVAGGAPFVTGGDGGFSVSGVVPGRVPVVVTPPPGVDPAVVVVTVAGDACDPCVVEVLAPTLPTTGRTDDLTASVVVLFLACGALMAVGSRRRALP